MTCFFNISIQSALFFRIFHLSFFGNIFISYLRYFRCIAIIGYYLFFRVSFFTNSGWGAIETAQSTSTWSTNMLRYDPRYYYNDFITYDYNFRQTCCSSGLCSLYYERRPVNDCSNYRPPAWGKDMCMCVYVCV